MAVIKLWGKETEVFVGILDELPPDVLIGVQALERLGYVVDSVSGRLEKVGLLAV